MKHALVMTGGIAKGAFQAGVAKSFAENNFVPSVVVGASVGALNAGMITKLIAEGNFTSEKVEETMIKVWKKESSLGTLWGKANPGNNDSIRNIFSDINSNPFLLIRKLSNLQLDVWNRIKLLFSLSFLSVFNNDGIMEMLEKNIQTPDKIINDVLCAVSLTDLLAHTEYIGGKPINNYSQYVHFDFKKGDNENLKEKFKLLSRVVQASATFPGMFPPSELDIHGKGIKKLYVDGGITKNAPFGRAIKLNPEIKYIFLVATTCITKPITNEVKNFPGLVGQVYEIIVTKDIANDYRKVVQINEKIKILRNIIERDSKGRVLPNEKNNQICKLAGFKSVEDFVSKRCVEVIFIEPDAPLEGDPFAAIYRKDRSYLLDSYIKSGYLTSNRVIKNFKENVLPYEEEDKVEVLA